MDWVAQNIFFLSPQFEILLCVQDHDDPAIDVCKKLLGKYPNVDARLFIGKSLINNLFLYQMKPVMEKHQAVWCWGTSRPSWIVLSVSSVQSCAGKRQGLWGVSPEERRPPACAPQLSCVYANAALGVDIDSCSLGAAGVSPGCCYPPRCLQPVRGDGLSRRWQLLLCTNLKPC